MVESEKDYSEVLELQARWDNLRIANVYDTLDHVGYRNQCLDLGIRPLFPHRHLAGRAITVRGSINPRTREDDEKGVVGGADAKSTASFVGVRDLVYPGCVVVIEGGKEPWSGHFGEMTSWSIQQKGAKGLVIDGRIRDRLGLEVIPDFTVCARGTSPIESYRNWRINATNITIGMPGTLTMWVRVDPGDWIIGGADGVMVIPQDIAMEVLVKAEEIERKEQGMRDDFQKGMSFDDAYKKWGRA